MQISNLRIGTRLGLAFTLVIALLCASLVSSITVLHHISDTMQEVVSESYAQIALSNQIKEVGDRGALTLGRMLLATEPQRQQKYMDAYAVLRATNTDNLKKLEQSLTNAESRALFEEQSEALSLIHIPSPRDS